MIVWLIDWLIVWLIDWLIVWLFVWLIDWYWASTWLRYQRGPLEHISKTCPKRLYNCKIHITKIKWVTFAHHFCCKSTTEYFPVYVFTFSLFLLQNEEVRMIEETDVRRLATENTKVSWSLLTFNSLQANLMSFILIVCNFFDISSPKSPNTELQSAFYTVSWNLLVNETKSELKIRAAFFGGGRGVLFQMIEYMIICNKNSCCWKQGKPQVLWKVISN